MNGDTADASCFHLCHYAGGASMGTTVHNPKMASVLLLETVLQAFVLPANGLPAGEQCVDF